MLYKVTPFVAPAGLVCNKVLIWNDSAYKIFLFLFQPEASVHSEVISLLGLRCNILEAETHTACTS